MVSDVIQFRFTRAPRQPAPRAGRGFTLVEILIVVVILGILAAVVIPQFAGANDEANAAALQTQLKTIRGQIEVYRAKHGEPPPLGTTGSESDWDVLVIPGGELSYLQGVPYNSFTGYAGIGTEAAIDIGWVWDATAGTITAPYFDEITGVYSPP
ncbi:MAG: prepilin-type N-terminal cleavage/methylation domain-containing protein [Planctomycetes bacterium]|nr:prepilin-type N-terminal cleavage/methylation domain-containing protein [Planctomycetota bacterium]NOG54117.1 prepilin-type N-terminal cleavage/methylation domain-containing protein [Planctomycetota bacterium]